MNIFRSLMRLALGRRLPRTSGECQLDGLQSEVRIRRDRWGIPVIEAEHDADAWFGLGFCQGQDRPVQLEALQRLSRGTLSELAGPTPLSIDRVSRRIGFWRSAQRQFPNLSEDTRTILQAFTAGVNAGMTAGLPRKPHEYVFLRTKPSPWEPADVLAMLKLQSFIMASNWDVELARLRIMLADGAKAMAQLDPLCPPEHPTAIPGLKGGEAIDRLAEDLALFGNAIPLGGGSNNWTLAARKTATGRPIVANDPHLAPLLPTHFYLAHLRTPHWALCGGSFIGSPAFPSAHNRHAAWGVTAGLIDDTDLFLEEIGPDGASVRQGNDDVPCEVVQETIHVKGGDSVIEEVLITPRGPIIGPALEGTTEALSIRATWLEPRPATGWLAVHTVKSFEEFREAFADWPALSSNLVYADMNGDIGWQVVGEAPQRKRGWGTIPLPGWDPENGWEDEPVPHADMPHLKNPDAGFIATANSRPLPEGQGPYLGHDFLDGYRVGEILSALEKRDDWSLSDCLNLQMDQHSMPWDEMREVILSAPETDEDTRTALELLRAWDGVVSTDSPAAAVFEMFIAKMVNAVISAKAPKSVGVAMGQGFWLTMPENFFSHRRVGHLSQLLREQPDGWFAEGWHSAVSSALGEAVRDLRGRFGNSIDRWAWGAIRPVIFRHIMFAPVRGLSRIFNEGPFPCGGDDNTIFQAASRPFDPLEPAHNIPCLRAVIDVGDWSNSRYVLAGGQSGNPCSPHYADMIPLWQRGETVPIPWTDAEIDKATVAELRLVPVQPAETG